jgi:hypothetical protein
VRDTEPDFQKEAFLEQLMERQVEFMGQTMKEKELIELISESKFLHHDPKVALIAEITRYLNN